MLAASYPTRNGKLMSTIFVKEWNGRGKGALLNNKMIRP